MWRFLDFVVTHRPSIFLLLQPFIEFKVSSGPKVINFFSMLNSTEHDISTAHKKTKILTKKKYLALSLSDLVFIMLKNVKMPTMVGILTFMSRINFMLS